MRRRKKIHQDGICHTNQVEKNLIEIELTSSANIHEIIE